MSKPIISVRNISKVYRLGEIGATSLREETARTLRRIRGKELPPDEGEFWALTDISFDVQPGEVVGIIGKNGAGKSTLLKVLSRVTEPSAGEIRLRGRIAALLEVGTGFHPELTGRENIYLNGTILGMKKKEIDKKLDQIIDFSGIEKHIDTPVKRFSSGMNVRLGFAVAAHLEPEILIVDEVLAVGDAEFRKKCVEKMAAVAKEGRTILFVSHNMSVVRSLCPRSILLEKGSILTDADTQDVMKVYKSNSDQMRGISLDQRDDREGSGLVKMKRILMNGSSDSIITVEAMTRAEFLIELDRPLAGAVCLFSIYDDSERMVAHFRSDSSLHETAIAKTTCYKAIIEHIPLLPGEYSVNVAIINSSEICDRVTNAFLIDVQDSQYEGTMIADTGTDARVFVPHIWDFS